MDLIAALAYFLYALALLLALASFRGDSARRKYFRERLAARLPDADCPPATVIVPVKGMDEGLAENLAALAALDYPDYELLVAVREATDLPPGVLPPRARLIIAGAAGDAATSHKITNLLAAVDSARPESDIFAFADSDGRPIDQWLRALASELRDPQVGASTGYRWYIPEPPLSIVSAANIRSAWNAVVAGTFGSQDCAFCWGGAMAITRANFERVNVRAHWLGQISDDFQLAESAHRAGLRVAFAPGAVVPCFDHTRWPEFLSWARRQLTLTRFYAPKLWGQALIAHVVYVLTIVLALVGPSPVRNVPVALVIIALGMWKSYTRARMYHLAHPHLRSQAVPHMMLAVVSTFVWLATLLASATSNTITWRGVCYDLRRP